jgi:hypothetical protein
MGSAQVTLSQGIYIIKDGPLIVSSGSSLTGDYVGFYLTGKTAQLHFTPDTTVSLSAPKTGQMAGLLFFRDRDAQTDDVLSISSNNARRLVGTMYLPRSTLRIDAQRPIADMSAYTVIVVRRLQLFSGPNLGLNTSYGASDVPVPKGIGPLARSISLAQ